MSSATEKILEPYLAGGDMRPNGDLDMHCPLHEDKRRSATVNFKTREWYCNGCEDGGSLSGLLDRQSEWLDPPAEAVGSYSGKQLKKRPLPDSARLDGWQQALLSNEGAMEYLETQRGLNLDTIQRFKLGWDGRRFTIPIFDDAGVLKNVRCYSNVLTGSGDSKIINWSGYGSPPRLFPMNILLRDPKVIWIVEGEFDAILSVQQGLDAVTATAGVKQLGLWRESWSSWFRNKTIFICLDRDADGTLASRRLAERLKKYAKRLSIIELPYPDGTGKDLTDYFLDGGNPASLRKKHAKRPEAVKRPKRKYTERKYDDLRSGKIAGKPIMFEATTAGILSQQMYLPTTIQAACNMDWDPKRCATCPMYAMDGKMDFDVEHNSDLLLDLLKMSGSEGRDRRYKREMKIPQNCSMVNIDANLRGAWNAEVRNGSNLQEEAIPVVIYQDGEMPAVNYPFKFYGSAHPDSKGQRVIVIAKKFEPAKQDLDNFVVTPEMAGLAQDWVAKFGNSTPESKLNAISDMYAEHVTRIFDQRKLHIAIDLVYHSVLKFKIGSIEPERGWMELLAVGLTRSGKSTTAQKLIKAFGYGQLRSGENTTVAGLLGGVEKRGGGENWAISVGELPLCDRRLLVIDEAQGLEVSKIGQMSDVRSRGVVSISKIRAGTYNARVRLIWIANKRQPAYKHGIDALSDQMGQDEDLARIDIPLFVGKPAPDEVKRAFDPYEDISQGDLAIIRWIILWAWSRKSEHVIWEPDALSRLKDLTDALAESYSIQKPPIFQSSEAHVRVARMAVAIAARLFSTDDGERLIVTTDHVGAAYDLYDMFFGDKSLGITDIMEDEVSVEQAGDTNIEPLKAILDRSNPEVASKLAEGQFEWLEYGAYNDTQFTMGELSSIRAIQRVSGKSRLYEVSEWAQAVAKDHERKMRGK